MRAKVVPAIAALPFFTIALGAAPAWAQVAESASTPEVEVRGPPASPASAPLDGSVAGSTIRRAELERPGLTAPAVLRTEVGLSITETGGLGAASTASIRGATSAETPVYLGGVRINDDVAGSADLSTLPLWLIDRVEIYRGNAPFEVDRFGIGGAMLFQPIRPRDTQASIGVSGGSYGSEGAHAYGSLASPKHGVLVGASFQGAQNDYEFTDNTGETQRWQNTDATLVDLWLLGRTEVGRGSLDLTLNHFRREQGAVRLASVQTYHARRSLERTLGALTARTPLGARGMLELRTSALLAGSTLDDPYQEILPNTGTPGTALAQRGERVEEEASVRLEPNLSTRVRLAVQTSSENLRRYEHAELAGIGPVLDAARVTGRLAGSVESDVIHWLTIRALLALECHSTSTGESFGLCDSLEPVGRLGGLWHAGELTGFVAVGRYSRPPTLGELYGTSLVTEGNPALEAESGTTVDVGVRFAHALAGQTTPLYAAVSGYARRSSELIAFVRTTSGFVRPENINAADAFGLELEAGSGIGRFFAADLALTLFDFRDRTEGLTRVNDILPYHSRLIAAPGLTATTPELDSRWVSRATLGARLVYQSNRYGDLAGTGVIPEQTSLDLDAGLLLLDRTLWLRGRVTDLLDSPRWDIVGFPLPGRSVFVSLEARVGSN
ncbi:MAG TPA: TonB-dependent receptor [Polyangiaceae bacterium]|nr:TonB-dependent receptor [Polyangiaceae bacterium]